MITAVFVALALVVVALASRLSDFFLLAYLFIGLYLANLAWIRLAGPGLRVRREFQKRSFLGESSTVELVVENRNWLPIPWLNLNEQIPVELGHRDALNLAVALPPRAERRYRYEITGGQRGVYLLGPLEISYGDVFGIHRREARIREGERKYVYPRIIPIPDLGLPSTTPMGTERSAVRIYEDPSRVAGVREYTPSDSPRLINWKASAARGQILVRQLQPAVSHEVLIVVDLNPNEYSSGWAPYASELSITGAASFANNLIERRQAVGLIVNGLDRSEEISRPAAQLAMRTRRLRNPGVPIGRGRRHLMGILEMLARSAMLPRADFSAQVRNHLARLSFGSTIVMFAGGRTDHLPMLKRMQRQGHKVMVIYSDPEHAAAAQAKASSVAINAFVATDREDYANWGRRLRPAS